MLEKAVYLAGGALLAIVGMQAMPSQAQVDRSDPHVALAAVGNGVYYAYGNTIQFCRTVTERTIGGDPIQLVRCNRQ